MSNANAIAAECKRYEESSKLNDRELLGELEQVSWEIPNLDLWILVTSRSVSDQLAIALVRSARKKGFEASIIDTVESDNSPSALTVLCAHNSDITLQFLQNNHPNPQLTDIRKVLKNIRQHPRYQKVFKRLQCEFSTAEIGYDNWRHCQNSWLLEKFQSENESRAAFNQNINVLDNSAWRVERESINVGLDKWLQGSWPKKQEFLALLGEEGDGKTWAIAAWLAQKVQADNDFPAVLFLTSNALPLSSEPQELLAQAIARQTSEFDAQYWEKRIGRWMQREPVEYPQIVLVFDGLNERHEPDYWRTLLEKLNAEFWKKQVGVILTCRNIPWKNHYASLPYLSVQSLAIPPFDDDELIAALSQHNMTLSDIEPLLLPLIRKSRYLDLTIQHYQDMVESGDPTVERLIYEDWRDRFQRKPGIKLTHEEFHELIRELAEKTSSFSQRDVEDLLPSDARQAVYELISGGILAQSPVNTAKYVVEPLRLDHGLGLLLKQEVHQALLSDLPIEEHIAQFIEPYSDIDRKVKIYEAALVHAIMDDEYPEEGKYHLLRLWVGSRNLDENAQENITAYLPCCPEIYIQLAEYLWSEQYNNPFAQTLLMRGFLKWMENPKVQSVLFATIERWLGFLHPYSFVMQRGRTLEESEKLRQEIESRAGTQLELGRFNFYGYELTVIEDTYLLRLAKVALAIISHSPRIPFVKALAVWSLSRSIMGHPDEHESVSWLLKTTKENIWEPLKAEIDRLIAINLPVTQQAAYRLLSFLGTQEAYRLRGTLPADLFPPGPLQEMYEDDPCEQGFYLWDRKNYWNCLKRAELGPYHVASKMKVLSLEPGLPIPSNFGERLTSLLGEEFSPESFWKVLDRTSADHQLEEVETTLAAFAPEILAKIFRNIIRDVSNRNDVALKQLALRIERNLLVLRKEERTPIEQAWENLISRWEELNDSERWAEHDMFPAILTGLSAKEQLEALLARPDDAPDLVQYRHLFKILDPRDAENLLHNSSNTSNPRHLQRILWFIFVNPVPLSPSAGRKLANCLKHEDTITRRFVLELIHKSQNEEAIQIVVNGPWGWHPEHWFKEDQWGSRLLCEFGASLPFQAIRTRVHPVFLGYAVEKRGFIDKDIAQYAEDIHTLWQRIKEKGTARPESFPDTEVRYDYTQEIPLFDAMKISTDFEEVSFTLGPDYSSWGGKSSSEARNDELHEIFHQNDDKLFKQRNALLEETLKQQAKAGNHWFTEQFSISSLKEVVSLRPDLLRQWLQAVYGETREASLLLWKCGSFYDALLRVLFEEKPDEALRLWHRLEALPHTIRFTDSNSGLLAKEMALFQCQTHEYVQPVWKEKLERCSNDLELSKFVFLAQYTGNTAWLKEIIQENQNSSWQFDRSKAISLLGFLEGDDSEVILQNYCDMPQCWEQRVAEKALKCYRKNLWSKQWFQIFLNDEDDVKAWACFKLFLKCVDRRFWLWEPEFVNEESLEDVRLEERVRFLRVNQNEVKNHIKKNEKKRKDTFLGEKVLKDKVWPWMNL